MAGRPGGPRPTILWNRMRKMRPVTPCRSLKANCFSCCLLFSPTLERVVCRAPDQEYNQNPWVPGQGWETALRLGCHLGLEQKLHFSETAGRDHCCVSGGS